MKIRFYLATALAALVMTNCSHEEEMPQAVNNPKSFTATIEGASRSSVTDEGAFSWTYGDKFSVWNGTSFDVYANSEEDVNTFVAEGDNVGNATGYAVYPSGNHNISDGTVTVNLPATYTYGSTNAAMLATIEDGSKHLAFKHLGGLMRFKVENVPANATSFVFTATDNILTGNYTVTDGQICQDAENSVNGNNSVTITFDALTAAQNMTFYVPLPVGTYGEYKVEIKGTNIDLSHTSEGVTNTIGRRTLLLMPTFTVENGELKKGAGSTIDVTAEEASVSGNQSLTINAEGADANATLVLNYTPQEGNATLSLSDGSEEAEPQTSAATVKVAPTTADVAIEALNINTPTLTVELGAGQYGTIEALTATQTLKVGANVTIETLVLNGGNLDVDETATIGEIVVKDAAGFTNALTAGANVVTLASDIDLALTAETALTIAEGKEIAIDLGGNTLTTSSTQATKLFDDITVNGKLSVSNGTVSTANAAFWVDGGELTLKECTISSERTGATTVCVLNSGKLEATDCKVNVAGTALKVKKGGTMTLIDCEATTTSTTGSAVVTSTDANSTLTITGGSYKGVLTETAHDRYVIGVKGGSTATINTTVQNGNGGVTVIGGSTANLTGGSYTGGKACGLYVNESSTVTYADGCTFSGVEGDVVVGGNGTVNEETYTEYTKIQQSVSTAEAFKAALNDSRNIILTANIDLALTAETALTIAEGKEIAIDLGGNTLTTSSTQATKLFDDITVNGKLSVSNGTVSTANAAFWVDGGELTLKECTISSERTGATTVCVLNSGKLEATDCKVNVAGTALKVKKGGTMTLIDCEATTTSTTGSAVVTSTDANSTLTITGGSYKGVLTETAHDRYVIGVKGGSTATINTTVQNGNGGVTVIGGSTANLTGGSYTGGKACGLYVNEASTVTYTSDCKFSGVEADKKKADDASKLTEVSATEG